MLILYTTHTYMILLNILELLLLQKLVFSEFLFVILFVITNSHSHPIISLQFLLLLLVLELKIAIHDYYSKQLSKVILNQTNDATKI
jgi:hypothetical protein